MTETYNDNLHKGAIGKLYEYGRELRKTSMKAEKLLWQYLRNRKLNGLKFRRQHPLDKFIPDFYCHEKRLAIELDGDVHDERTIEEYDRARTQDLSELGIRIIRFRNEEIENKIEDVLKKITEAAVTSKGLDDRRGI